MTTFLTKSAESQVSKHTFCKECYRGDNICSEEHASYGFLWSNRVNDSWNGVMIDEDEHSVSKHGS